MIIIDYSPRHLYLISVYNYIIADNILQNLINFLLNIMKTSIVIITVK